MPDLSPVAVPARSPQSSARARDPIFLDNHATTPCDPRVVEVMLPFFLQGYANPSSTHRQGRAVAAAVTDAREQIASLLGSSPGEVAFTSGATESNNLAILGAARAAPDTRRRVLVSAIEHKAVLEPARALAREGYQVEVLPVESDGRIDLAVLSRLIDETTAIVSIQAASNEIGTLQPVAEIAQIVHEAGALFHADAAQAVGRIPVDVREWDVDLLSLSGHKCYGPKGVGALYVRGGYRSAPMDPLMFGGGQEGALRPGTLNVPGIIGLGRAAEIAATELVTEMQRIGALRDLFEKTLLQLLPDAQRNGAMLRRLPGNSSVRIPGVDAQAVVANLPDVAFSTGSACSSGAPEPSYVLLAMGLSRSHAAETLRVGLGRFTREADVEYAAARIAEVAVRIRQMT
jgi:cysteine desulfurase